MKRFSVKKLNLLQKRLNTAEKDLEKAKKDKQVLEQQVSKAEDKNKLL